MDTLALNNREIAALIWIGIVVGFVFWKAEGASAFLSVLRSLLQPQIAISLLAFGAYVAAVLLLLSTVDLWGLGLLPDAVIWTFAVGLPLFYRAASRDSVALRRRLGAALSITVVIEVFVNLEVASLPVELVALPLISLLGVTAIYIQANPESQPAAGFVEGLSALLGLAALTYVIVSVAVDWQGFDKLEAVRSFLLPVALTLFFIPFLVALWAYSAFDMARTRTRMYPTDD